jgi:hypothetical protein
MDRFATSAPLPDAEVDRSVFCRVPEIGPLALEEPMPKFLSVNVGVPCEIAGQGKVVRTAIWKRPVSGARLSHLDLDADGQAHLKGHGGERHAVWFVNSKPGRSKPGRFLNIPGAC